jgi:hypothetical protein
LDENYDTLGFSGHVTVTSQISREVIFIEIRIGDPRSHMYHECSPRLSLARPLSAQFSGGRLLQITGVFGESDRTLLVRPVYVRLRRAVAANYQCVMPHNILSLPCAGPWRPSPPPGQVLGCRLLCVSGIQPRVADARGVCGSRVLSLMRWGCIPV